MYVNSTASGHFTISSIGTCRLDVPLRAGARRRGYVCTGKRIYGYAHSISEVVQQVKFLHGDYTPEPSLWNVIAKHDLTRVSNEHFTPTDITLVEISSRKQLSIDGHAVQINHLKTVCAPFFDDTAHKTHFWNVLRAGDQSEQDNMIAAFAARFGLSPDQQHILRRLRMSITTDEELRSGLTYLRDALSDPVIITHVDAQKNDGARLASRSACIEQVTRLASEAGMTVFNPTALMQEIGQDRAIEDESDSLAHFTDLFACHLFDAWHDGFLSKRIDERMRTTTSDADLRKYETHMLACLTSDGIGDCGQRIDQLIAKSPPLVTEVQKTAIRLNIAAGRIEQAQAMAASLVLDGHFDRNLFFHATQHASRTADTGLLYHCIALARRDPQIETNLWLAPALAALATLDAKAVCKIYVDILSDHPALSGGLLASFYDLVAGDAMLLDKATLEGMPTRLIAEAVDGALLAKLCVFTGSDRVAFLLTLLAKKPEYFHTAVTVLAGHDLVRTMQTVRAILLVLHHNEHRQKEMARSLTVRADGENDPAARLEMLSVAVALDPANDAATTVMAALGKDCRARAKDAYATKDICALRSELDIAAQIVPPVDQVFYLMARLIYAEENYQDALCIAQRAADCGPRVARNWTMVLRSSVMLRDFDQAEHAAQKVLETAPLDDTRAIDEAKKRSLWARKKILARATVSEAPIDALLTMHKMRADPNLSIEVAKYAKLTITMVVGTLNGHLQSGQVDEAASLLHRLAPICLGDQNCREMVAQALNAVSYTRISRPVVESFANHIPDRSVDQDQLSFFRGFLLDNLHKSKC